MQLFSRNKALAALSLGALAALGACGDDVTVPVAPPAPVVISITPPNANMNIGESLNFAVQISGGSTTAAPTLASCTSSNTAVATATVSGQACRVTAVAAGNATITAAASSGQSAAAGISVAAPAPAITSLAVSPSAAQIGVGQSVTLVPTVQPAGRTATYTYATSTAAVATVNATGVVTAVAPGVATITVTATGSGTGLSTATINQAVTITVSERTPGLTALNVQPAQVALALGGTQALTFSVQGPRASAATITYGTSAPTVATVSAMGVITAVSQGTAVVTVTAQSTQDGAFAASSITALVPVTVSPNAQVAITGITIGSTNNPIDISNVTDQIQVNLAVQPNGQTVSEANVWVCNVGEAVPACAARTNGVPAARQSFTASGTQATNVQLFINTSEFDAPDFTTGADANTLYKNGLKTIVATLTTSPAAASTIASNSISQVNFNNPDGWTVRWTAPANRTNDVGNITWYGGPSTPDALTPAAQSGTGSFVVVPVVYTPNRTVVQATLNLSTSCGSNILDTQRPFGATYGTMARVSTDQAALNFNCSGAATTTAGLGPLVVGAVDNNNNGYNGTTAAPAVGRSIFDDFSNIANSTGGGFRQSLSYRPNNLYLPHDYAAPSISAFDIRGGGGTGVYVDSAWVNASYFLAGVNPTTQSGTGSLRYRISDGNVGLTSSTGSEIGSGAASRNTQFRICPNTTPTSTPSAPIDCTSPVATGGITSTIGSINLPEAADLTNRAYFAQVAETDRLGNRATSVAYSWSNSGTGASATQTPGISTASASPAAFGVDLTAPALVAIPNSGDAFPITGYARTDRDSIYATTASGLNGAGALAAENARFAVRFTDSRSGFPTCVAGNCFAGVGTDVRGGSFQIVRRQAPALPSVANDAQVQNLIGGATSGDLTARNSINAGLYGGDASVRQFSIEVFSVAGRNNMATLPTNLGNPTAGYYTFSGTLIDRAGNSTAIPNRSIAIDNLAPALANITVPSVLTGGTSVAFQPTGSDDLEAIAGDLALRYPQIGQVDFAAGVTQPTGIRFLRVPSFSATGLLGLWHNPFASVGDNKLATPIGQGTAIASAPLTLPIPFLQNISTVTNTDAPATVAALNGATNVKPDQVTAYLYDIRATSTQAFTDQGRSTALNATIGGGQVPTVTTKNWTDLAVTGTTPVGIQTWSAFNPSSSNLEFRAATSTSVTNPPFSSVYVIRAGATEWEYLGTATFAGTLDQGATRFFRYTFTFAGTSQGQFNQAALTNGDIVRAIGADASGNALSTRNVTFGLTNALPGTVNVTNTALATDPILNATAPQNITLNVSSNPNTANIVFGCSSNSAFVTATMINATTCQLSAAGVAAAAFNVQITFTATGSAAGFNTNTLSNTITVGRAP